MGAIDDLAAELSKLPGIGRKTALRLTYHLLKQSPEQSKRLATALSTLADKVRPCPQCFNLTEEDLCVFCRDARRDTGVICAVEEASDIGAIERSGEFRGVYHVLGGRLSPLDGIGPEDLTIPHPRMWERGFVLAPLRDVAPHLVDASARWEGVRDAGVTLESPPGV